MGRRLFERDAARGENGGPPPPQLALAYNPPQRAPLTGGRQRRDVRAPGSWILPGLPPSRIWPIQGCTGADHLPENGGLQGRGGSAFFELPRHMVRYQRAKSRIHIDGIDDEREPPLARPLRKTPTISIGCLPGRNPADRGEQKAAQTLPHEPLVPLAERDHEAHRQPIIQEPGAFCGACGGEQVPSQPITRRYPCRRPQAAARTPSISHGYGWSPALGVILRALHPTPPPTPQCAQPCSLQRPVPCRCRRVSPPRPGPPRKPGEPRQEFRRGGGGGGQVPEQSIPYLIEAILRKGVM